MKFVSKRSVTSKGLVAMFFFCAVVNGQQYVTGMCDPYDYKPTQENTTGCTWEYMGFKASEYTEITFSKESLKYGGWIGLPPCACGWYPSTVACPSCPPSTVPVQAVESLNWQITWINDPSHGKDLKAKLIQDIGFTGEVPENLSGSKVFNATINLAKEPVMCYERFYRTQWTEKVRHGRKVFHVDFDWGQWCDPGVTPSPAATKTVCKETLATGKATWNTLPAFQWAPQYPPCGGVAVTNPDPWDGKCEKPCCEGLCPPPAAPAHPCCGCEVVQ